MCCDDSCSDNCCIVFCCCNITSFKNVAKDSLPCPDNTNRFILFWVKYTYIYNDLIYVIIFGGFTVLEIMKHIYNISSCFCPGSQNPRSLGSKLIYITHENLNNLNSMINHHEKKVERFGIGNNWPKI